MRTILIFCYFIFNSLGGLSQEERKIERLWISANHGFNLYNEIGGQIQILDQLLLGAYYQNFRRNVGTGVPTNPYAIIFSGTNYKQDEVSSGSLMVGFASPITHSVMISFLAGPSFNRSISHSNFETTYSDNGYYPVSVSSSVSKRWKIGLNYKTTLSFIIRNHVCINLGLAGNYNGVDNYNRFILGIGIGEFGCFNPLRK